MKINLNQLTSIQFYVSYVYDKIAKRRRNIEAHLRKWETITDLLPCKVVRVIKCTCIVFTDNFRNISINSSVQVSVCRESYDGYVKHKRNDPMCDPWDSQGNEKCNFYFYYFLPGPFDQK